MIKVEEIYMFVGFLSTLVGFYGFFQKKTTDQEKKSTEQENRITKIELAVMQNSKDIYQNRKRIDNHDVDNKVMLALVEKVDGLKEDIAEIKQKIK